VHVAPVEQGHGGWVATTFPFTVTMLVPASSTVVVEPFGTSQTHALGRGPPGVSTTSAQFGAVPLEELQAARPAAAIRRRKVRTTDGGQQATRQGKRRDLGRLGDGEPMTSSAADSAARFGRDVGQGASGPLH
jgi:hypothetical protein